VKLEEARAEIEALGWHVVARRNWPDNRHRSAVDGFGGSTQVKGISFDATDYKRLAKGAVFVSEDQAMTSCLAAVRRKVS
jgi:hypothetical protein